MTQLVWLVVEIPGFRIILTEQYAANVSAVAAKKNGDTGIFSILKNTKLQTVLAASSLYSGLNPAVCARDLLELQVLCFFI